MESCVFCNNQEIQSRVIFKGEDIFVMLTNIPIVTGHLLILPIRHVHQIDELNQNEQKAIFEIIPKLRLVLRSAFGAEGFNYAWNEGEAAGQSVKHLHMHMLPRKAGDVGIAKYEPREFLYRPGSREASPKAELDSVAELIKSKINF